jgi:hypothetical protein
MRNKELRAQKRKKAPTSRGNRRMWDIFFTLPFKFKKFKNHLNKKKE